MTAGPRSIVFLLLLLAASAALGMHIRDEMRRPLDTPDTIEFDPTTSDPGAEIPELPKYDPPPIERFSAALERPLFSEDRRPSDDQPVVAAVTEDRTLSATLQGILFTNLEGVALLSQIGEETTVRVSKGDVFLGWQLLEIHFDKVVFGRDDETVTLELIYKDQTPPPERRRERP